MLNELYQLSIALQAAAITPCDWHKDFKSLPKANEKKPCYKITLGSNSKIADIVPLGNDFSGLLRKWEPSNGNSFPAFNIPPLYRVVAQDRKKMIEQWRKGKSVVNGKQLRCWCEESHAQNWDKNTASKLNRCLLEIPKALALKLGNIPETFIAVQNLFVKCATFSDTSFRDVLEECIWSKIEKGEQVSQILPFLVYETDPDKTPEKDRGSLSVFLDVQMWTEYPVAHEKTIAWINERLIEYKNEAPPQTKNVADAYAHPNAGDDEKFPEVRLPILGAVKLRAMNKESPCQQRYGTIDASSFRVGGESRRRMKGALEWLGDPIREGLTWGRIPGKELLFAYPSVMPPLPLKLASCFGACNVDDGPARFEQYARDVVLGLSGLIKPLKAIDLEIFSLRKMDKARTKVIFHRSYTAQRLADAAKDWQNGCMNIPHIRFSTWGDKKSERRSVEPASPFPLQIAQCLNQVWKLDGTTENNISVISRTAGIELLLDEQPSPRLVAHLLTTALKNGKGLLLSMGNQMHKGEALSIKGIDQQKQWLPAIMGLLLHKIGVRKEDYMNEAPYLIGILLKVSDDLHALYCKEVRKEKLPPQLLGNALMVSALESPTQALAQLALRIAPYLGWAKTNSSKSVGLSRYFLKAYGEYAGKLKDQILPSRLGDAERAQLLLGYLAATCSETVNSITEEGEKNDE